MLKMSNRARCLSHTKSKIGMFFEIYKIIILVAHNNIYFTIIVLIIYLRHLSTTRFMHMFLNANLDKSCKRRSI